MKINAWLAILLIAGLNSLPALSQNINPMSPDAKLGYEVLCGECDRNGLQQGNFGILFHENHQAYTPDKTVISGLKGKSEGVEIKIVLGTWCSDSQELVPGFFKILDKIRFPKDRVKMICVNSDKEACGVDISTLGIRKVPTFIIYRNGSEIGRIIESPYHTLEKDLLMFLEE